jgi:hypothetical protein
VVTLTIKAVTKMIIDKNLGISPKKLDAKTGRTGNRE